jgi:hypothetical protein
MLRTGILRLHEDQVDRFPNWMGELNTRVAEVRETFEREGTRHEQVHLVETSHGPLVFHVMEVEDAEASLKAFEDSELPIDVEHKEMMRSTVAERLPAEILLDISSE